jgi:hypothetical protein
MLASSSVPQCREALAGAHRSAVIPSTKLFPRHIRGDSPPRYWHIRHSLTPRRGWKDIICGVPDRAKCPITYE